MFVIGDVHGHYDKLVELLRDEARVVRHDLTWIGGKSKVCFLGDYFDRGPDGIRAVDLLISLQIQAQMYGGEVIALLGNHDMLIVAAHRFDKRLGSSGPKGNFYEDWQQFGGNRRDLDQMTPEHIAWLTHLPAMALVNDCLLLHADSTFYTQYGSNITEVNQAVERVMMSYDIAAWDKLLVGFSEKYGFSDRDWYGKPKKGGKDSATLMLKTFGGKRILHGHTPVFRMIDQQPEYINKALVYADDLVVNVDGGIYAGGGGFVYEVT